MYLKAAAPLLGIFFLVFGFLGFVPAAAPEGMLFGTFHANVAHSIIRMISGSIAVICALGSAHACRVFFRIFALVYGVVAILGFVQPDVSILGLISHNVADTWLHAGIAATSLILGFAVPQRVAHRARV